jgi:DNA-binding NarL/FixJ family response regulator
MKTQPNTNFNVLVDAGSIYSSVSVQYLKKLIDLSVQENTNLIEQMQARCHELFQAKDQATAFQLAAENWSTSTQAMINFGLKAYALGKEEQSALLSAVQKQISDGCASLAASLEQIPSEATPSSAVMLTAFKSALEMGNRVIDSAQLASKKTVELANQSLTAAMQHQNNVIKENHKGSKKSIEA